MAVHGSPNLLEDQCRVFERFNSASLLEYLYDVVLESFFINRCSNVLWKINEGDVNTFVLLSNKKKGKRW